MGVCVGVDADGQIRPVQDGNIPALDQDTVTGVIRENEVGMLVNFTEAFIDDLTAVCIIGLRYRLQVLIYE